MTSTLNNILKFAVSSMIEENSGENRGEIEEESPKIEGEAAEPAEETNRNHPKFHQDNIVASLYQ